MCGFSFTVFLSAFQLLPTAPFHILELGGGTSAAGLFLGPFLTALWAVCIIGPFTGTFLGFAAGSALLSCIVPGLVLTKRLRWKSRAAFATPFVFPALFYAIFRSTIITLKQGGIRWRDTFYPLDKLRAGNVY